MSELFPASHSSLRSYVELQGEVGGAGTFAWLRLMHARVVSGKQEQSSVCPSTLYWEQASHYILLTSGAWVRLSTTLCLVPAAPSASWRGLLLYVGPRIGL